MPAFASSSGYSPFLSGGSAPAAAAAPAAASSGAYAPFLSAIPGTDGAKVQNALGKPAAKSGAYSKFLAPDKVFAGMY